MYRMLYILFISLIFTNDYSLKDLNPSSVTYQENVGPSYFPDKVTVHYFGHYS